MARSKTKPKTGGYLLRGVGDSGNTYAIAHHAENQHQLNTTVQTDGLKSQERN